MAIPERTIGLFARGTLRARLRAIFDLLQGDSGTADCNATTAIGEKMELSL